MEVLEIWQLHDKSSASYIVLHNEGKVRDRSTGGKSFAMSIRSSHGRLKSPTDMPATGHDDGKATVYLLSAHLT